jgi:hydroxysqualene synthase
MEGARSSGCAGLAMIHSGELRSGKGSHDENFPVASRLIKRQHRPAILAFYEFVRVADDIADHPELTSAEKIARLDRLESNLIGSGGDEPEGLRLRAILNDRGLSTRHAQDLLSAFRQDATKHRYANWEELIDYCSRSAMPVGRFVLDVHGETRDTWPASDALCAALQIINHLQDCAKDYQALDRVYIPLDAMSASGVSVEMLKEDRASPALRDCLRGLVARTSVLLDESRGLEAKVGDTRLALEISVIQSLASQLLAILTVRDPLVDRVHLNKAEALAAAANGGGRAILRRLLRTMAPAQRFQTP